MRWNKAASVAVGFGCTVALWGCGAGSDAGPVDTGYTNMESDTASCEFDVVTFAIADAEPQEVPINGLSVAELLGADRVAEDIWEPVQRRGVRFSEILTEAGISLSDETPVNCVARDGFDPLRTRLANDTPLLPRFEFLRDHGYVYVGSPGDKDPLYPEMEGRSLIVDYDVGTDAEVPAYLGGALASIGMFRWKMIEKLDDEQRGIIELDPIVP